VPYGLNFELNFQKLPEESIEQAADRLTQFVFKITEEWF
jgi:hypothetical protein